TLRSIGDAEITTAAQESVVLMNPVAEALTGWRKDEAVGRPLANVFRIINEGTCETFESPAARVLHKGQVIGLASHTVRRAHLPRRN
ncbi:MAG: PAS domain-containing protein, partial [Rhodocyclaceae bacterium]